jgi:hypothetical protein
VITRDLDNHEFSVFFLRKNIKTKLLNTSVAVDFSVRGSRMMINQWVINTLVGDQLSLAIALA